MTRHPTSLPPAYFDARYAADPDPWGFATSDYERAKYDATLLALPRPSYPAALEIGCSIGVLTRRLAARCETLLALDVADTALDEARARCRDLPRVSFARATVPAEWPAGTFDLVLLSEVVYYLDRHDVSRLIERLRDGLAPGGDVVLVHWTGETDYPLGGEEAADLVIAGSRSFLSLVGQSRTDAYRLDVLSKRESGATGERRSYPQVEDR